MAMIQYGLWSNCPNSCEFCLLVNKVFRSKEEMILEIQRTKENIKIQDWDNLYRHGISLLGGELYYVTDADIQNEFMLLIDEIIDVVLIGRRQAKYSTVSNGLYDPAFLYRVIDRIIQKVGISSIDFNFSYDLYHRFKTEKDRQRVLTNINEFGKRYKYSVGVQMITTEHVIQDIKNGVWDPVQFEREVIPYGTLALLYPHKIRTGIDVPLFNFSRESLLWFVQYLEDKMPLTLTHFVESVEYSSVFKHSGRILKLTDTTEIARLSSEKTEQNPKCGHSTLYQCYSDCDNCLLCDLRSLHW
jgi:hypothetical protein